MLIFDKKKCIGCGRCILSCPRKSITQEVKGDTPNYLAKRGCMFCGHCVSVCPRDAIVNIKMPKKNFVTNDVKFSSEDMSKFLGAKRSIRNFTKKPIENKIFNQMLTVAEYAPSEANYHDNKYIVLSNQKTIYKLKEIIVNGYRAYLKEAIKNNMPENSIEMQTTNIVINKFNSGEDPIFWDAPYLIFIHGPKEHTFSEYDAIVSGTYLMIQAETLGIGTCIIGRALYYPDLFNEILDIPKGNKIFSTIAVGYPKLNYGRTVHRNEPKIRYI